VAAVLTVQVFSAEISFPKKGNTFILWLIPNLQQTKGGREWGEGMK